MTKNKGYTLIEILIVMAILGILFVVGYGGFRDFSRREQVNGAMLTLIADLRQAQAQNLAGKKPFGCTGVLKGYSVTVINSTSYKVTANCVNNGIANDVDIKTVNLPVNITINTPTPNPIFFKAVGQGTNIPSGNFATLFLTQAVTQNSRNVAISSSGELREDSGLARADLTPSPTAFYATSTPKPTPTPTPTAPPTWVTVGTLNLGCGTTISINAIASQVQAIMTSGGGSDSTISYNCYGSTGIDVLANGTWQKLQDLSCPMSIGATKLVNLGSNQTISSIRSNIGCNDGETANMTISYYGIAPTPTPPSLVGEWKFEEASGQTITDTSGNNSNGTLGSSSAAASDDPTRVAGKYGNGLSFDGVDDYVNIPHTPFLNFGKASDTFTLMAWFKTSNSTANKGIVAKGRPNNVVDIAYVLSIPTTVVKAQRWCQGCPDTGHSFLGTTNVTDGVWHHVAFVANGASSHILYVDGQVQNTDTTNWTGYDDDNTEPLEIGRYKNYTFATNMFTGTIDEVRLYNYALTPQQVVSAMNGS
jgi:prepilin-type N-terminal cleavage/methylation domain-containing protein